MARWVLACSEPKDLSSDPRGGRGPLAERLSSDLHTCAVATTEVSAGVIDEDYRGNVGVVLFNFGKEKFEVKKGDRIAQLICERILYPDLEEVQTLDNTERGSGGFGSTGKN
ncbi:deoxyuridine 5'-triphosphate nucleotidohydrolase isoform X13 [Rattus norvegicus]|uniref:deoxyuridine 5'-triphosphate nucleotidohydrolase isoform X13 n=1 Tax=Rattus norvegicus TaxID=10116 RepID=UPI001917667C|nr:deoxyuridine 5'-triphosphate nucleotidohydrolase isoform X3 [Rattus norvegicus]